MPLVGISLPLLATTAVLLGGPSCWLDEGAKGLGGGERKPWAWADWTREENMPGSCGGWGWGPYPNPNPNPNPPIAPGLIIVIAAVFGWWWPDDAYPGPIDAKADIPIGAGGGR